jgi:hypothetical protein
MVTTDPSTAPVSRAPAVVTTTPPTLSWGAIFAGAVAALGVGALLHSFGLALGLSAINPDNPATLRPSGIFTGIWGLVAALLALFVGGFVAARGAGVFTRAAGALHGLVMWGLTVIAGLWLVGNIASAVISGAAVFGRAAVQGAESRESSGLVDRFGITSADVVAPVNERLRASGRPEVTPQELERATRDVVQQAVREGRLDRQMLVQAIAQNTALTRAEASDIAGRMQAKFETATTKMQGTALEAADAAGKALWGVFGALFLGLVAAILGAIVGTPGARRPRLERRPVVEREPPPGPREEAYP